MLRTILLLLAAVLYLILTLPVLLVLTLIGKKNPGKRERVSTAMIRWIFRVLSTISGAKITVRGLERIPKDQAVLYVGNHRSIFDIILVHPFTAGRTGFVAKNSLARVPIFSVWCKYICCLFFDRENMREGLQMIRDGIALLDRGVSVFIFPEGTRSKQDDDLPLLPFHEGSFRIATRNSHPIVPVAISNTAAIFEKQKPRVKSRHVVIEFCEPIETASLSRDEKKHLGEHASEIITETIRQNKQFL
ncbi:MAG: 1-acyl-sn-glycerol-3-phosphate acyltransferase [Eubacterium sp.]|nr:1-acyl-sn-glycerol-3-phosphate acyltransferase [Eubacterium sp.]